MLVLFETAAGLAVFKLLDEKKIQEADNIWKEFETPESASKILKLKAFKKFKDTTDALQAANAICEGKLSKQMKKLLKKLTFDEVHEKLAVADAKLGNLIKEKLEIPCVHDSKIAELMRCIRMQFESLVAELPKRDMDAMMLGLAHSLSRYKLKFSPEKIDTMIIQAVSLLDDLDKELNNYVMRCREWYGWHFPELGKIIQDHTAFAKVVLKMGMRENGKVTDLSDILPPELEAKLKEAAELSMGTEVSALDIMNIQSLCDQIIEITKYREQLYEYLKARMMALAPNLTVLLGELVGARLIAHAGSLMNLAKYPASTVQILGAEKALFRALKTKKDTPKYGLIYHAQLIGQATGKLKGKISRSLAAKAALACRVDALGEDNAADLGIEHRAKLENRLAMLTNQGVSRISGTGKQRAGMQKHQFNKHSTPYDSKADVTAEPSKKRKFENFEEVADEAAPAKKLKFEPEESTEATGPSEPVSDKKKKKKAKQEPEEESVIKEEEVDESPAPKKKKKKKQKSEDE